ncbi:immunoglobulin superfamily member 1-like [Acipenser ruthenus]|uniref:immunoglobulin superfamily member 1-like n=1 Tax=Acipenser ruthenus TaxID=7906 RepID=UPI0027409A26|nr:immunoglobulin superfamily member 1-like [Acipenser ruthenus]
MPWNIKVVMLFFALGDMLLVSTEPVRTAIIQIGKASVVEGEKVEFKCVTSAVHGEQPENKEMNWFHLYKNREKISSLPKPGGTGAVTFIKQDIRKNDAGDYTCMYGNENPGDVKNISHGSSVYLNVQELSYQLTLQLDKHNQMEGMDVSFQCIIPVEFRDAIGKEGFFHLYKNGSLVVSQHDPKGISAVKFSIKKVKRSDTGNYTCVYGKEKLVNSANSKRSRPVYLHVTGDMTTPTTSIKTQQTNETGKWGQHFQLQNESTSFVYPQNGRNRLE